MRNHTLIFSSLLLFCSLSTVHADTIIESHADGENTQTEISGDHIRAGSGEGYMLIDTRSAHMYVVDTKQRVVRDFGAMPARASGKLPQGAKLSGPTTGPTIAGFATKIYQLEADGHTCGQFFMSRQALKIKDLQRLARFFNEHKTPFGDMAQGFDNDPCSKAEQAMDNQIYRLGVSMRETDANGKIKNEITAIKTNASIPASRMQLPSDYRHEDATKQLNEAQKAMQHYQQMMQEQMKHMSPQQRQMLEQMMKQKN